MAKSPFPPPSAKIVRKDGKWLLINQFGKVVGSFATYRDAIIARAKGSKKK